MYKQEDAIIRAFMSNEKIQLAQTRLKQLTQSFGDRLHASMIRTDKLHRPSSSLKSGYESRSHLDVLQARLARLRARLA